MEYGDFQYAPGQPNLYRLMRHKQEVIAADGVTAGFERFKADCNLPPTLELGRETLASEHEHAVQHARSFAELAPAGQQIRHEPPVVKGEGNHAVVTGVTRSLYVACLEAASVRGRSALPTVEGDTLLLDVQAHERGLLNDELEWDPKVFHAVGDQAFYLPAGDEHDPLQIDEAFWLLGAHTDFFGHWMCEYLPKLIVAHDSLALPPGVPVLVDEHMPPAHVEALRLLFGANLAVIEVPAFRTVKAKSLWVVPSLMYMPLHEQRNERFDWGIVASPRERMGEVTADMKRRAAAALGSVDDGPDRVFLARRSFRHREMVNAAEVIAIAREFGFSIVYAEDLTFAEQVNVVRGARVILAPEGSSIFLTFFAAEGARLGILSHPLTDVLADYNGILQTQGVQTSVLTGPIVEPDARTPHDSDYLIDVQRFREFALSLIP